MEQDKENEIKRADVRTEYSELAKYFTTVITFRFTLLGFYLAAVGLIVKEGVSLGNAFLLLGISIFLWCLDLRSRTIYYDLSNRAMQIEREIWGYKKGKAYDPFFSRLMKIKPDRAKDPEAPDPPEFQRPRWFGREFPAKLRNFSNKYITQSVAIDCLFSLVILYTLRLLQNTSQNVLKIGPVYTGQLV